MRIDNPSISGSLSFIGGTNSISATSVSLTGSLSGTFEGAFSSTATANISGAFDSVSQSLASDISLNRSSINSLNSASSSYLLNTTDTLDGDLTVTGTITAQEFHTEFVSASIIYQSGSTKFGDTSDDNHDFTGSVSIASGSLQVWQTTSSKYLNIFGGNSGNFIDSYGADLYLRADGNSNNSLIIFNSGNVRAHRNFYVDENVGIGTTSPGVKLTVLENVANFASTITNSNSSGQGVQITGGNGTSNVLQLRNYLGGEVMRVQGNSTIGIGTTDPQTNLLSIRGFGAIDSNANQGLVLSSNHYYDSGDKYIGNGYASIISQDTGGSYAGFIRFQQAGLNSSGAGAAMTLTDSMVIDESGNVGIGTTSPDTALTIESTTSPEIKISNGGGTSPSPTLTFFRQSGVSAFVRYDVANKNIIIQNSYSTADSAGNIYFNTRGGTARMAITGAGNVGIGTTSPSSLLHIVGSTPTVKVEGSSTDSAKIDLVGTFTTWSLENQYVNGQTNDMFRLYNSALGADAITVNRSTNNVGIGTTSPLYKLHVGGSTYVNSGTLFLDSGNYLMWGNSAQGIRGVNDTSLEFLVGSSTKMYIKSDGNVGIGTTSPANLLHIKGDNRAIIIGDNNTTTGDTIGELQFYASNLSNYSTGIKGIVDSAAPGIDRTSLTFHTTTYTTSLQTGIERMRINDVGNVGIGTTSPSVKTHIYTSTDISYHGSEYTYGLWVSQTDPLKSTVLGYSNTYNAGILQAVHTGVAWKNILIAPSGGNVGIGTTSPQSKLHVNGTFRSTGIQDAADALAIFINGNEEVGIGTTSPTQKLHVRGSGIYLHNDIDTTNTYITAENSGAGNAGIRMKNNQGEWILIANDRLRVIDQDAGGTERLSILSDGNVGISTTSPVSILELVDDTPTLTISDTGNNYNDGDVQSVVHLSGRWYSGESNPNTDLYSDARMVLRKDHTDGTGGSSLGFEISGVGATGLLEVMRITKEGRLGVRTDTPSGVLHVLGDYYLQNGNMSVTQNYGITWNNGDNYIKGIGGYHLQFTTYDGSSAQNEVLRLTGGSTASGGARAGIGQTSPAAKLDVNGDVAIAKNIGWYNATGILNAGSAIWNKLGTWHTSQGGYNLHLEVHGGAGYNANDGQQSVAHIYFRTSNGSSTQNGMYADGYYYIEGASNIFTQVVAKEISSDEYEFYVYTATFTGNPHIEAHCARGTYWDNDGSHNTGSPTGTTSSLSEYYYIHSPTTINSDLNIGGSLTKGSGTFKIDHPLEGKSETHYLVHSFVESPKTDLLYRGKSTLVSGSINIDIDDYVGMTPGTFGALVDDTQVFTTNESNWDLVKGSISGSLLTIESQNSDSTAEISWLVIGDRKDKHILETSWTDENGKPILEPLKPTIE